MVERKLYKTKLCVLYQRGRCHRLSCSFAHGNAELRRFSDDNSSPAYLTGGSMNVHCYVSLVVVLCNGRRDFRGRDLREKLDRRRSPVGRYSTDRDARERNASRGRSPTESAGRRSGGKRRMEHHSDGRSDISGSLNMSDGTEDHVKEKKYLSSNSTDAHQLRELQTEIDSLDDQKQELEIYLEDTTREMDSLALKNRELEMEFSKEKEECKRITLKIKKFLEAYNDHSRLEGELKRSEAQLQKLASKLSSDLIRNGANGEDSSINMSDGGMTDNHFSASDEHQKNTSPPKKRPRIHREADETSNQVSTKAKVNASQRIAYPARLNNEKKERAEFNWDDGYKTLVSEEKSKKGSFSRGMTVVNKPKASDIGTVLPSTSMAAHAADEDVEDIEMEEKLEVAGNATRRAGKGTPSGIAEYPFLPPPPPLSKGAYLQQYKGDDADGLDEETVEVDIV